MGQLPKTKPMYPLFWNVDSADIDSVGGSGTNAHVDVELDGEANKVFIFSPLQEESVCTYFPHHPQRC